MSFFIFINFFNIKNHCFKTVSSRGGSSSRSSSSCSSRSYSNFSKKNPDINVTKYKVHKPYYNYRSYRGNYYRPYDNYYRPYRSYYYSPLPFYYYNHYYYNSYPNYQNYGYEMNNNYGYRYYHNDSLITLYVILIFFIIIFALYISYKLYDEYKEKNSKYTTYSTYEGYDYNNSNKTYSEKLNFNNSNTFNHISKLNIPEILQVKIPDYDEVNYYIYNTRDDDNKIENPEFFISILKGIDMSNSYVKNMEIILSPSNIFFLNLPNILNMLRDMSSNINIHFAFVKEFYEKDFNIIELRDILKILCNLVKNDPIKIIGYNFDEDEKNSFSTNLNIIFNENLNLLEDFAKLQFVKN